MRYSQELAPIPEIPEGELRSAISCLLRASTTFHRLCETMPEYREAVEHGDYFRRCEGVLEKWRGHLGHDVEELLDDLD